MQLQRLLDTIPQQYRQQFLRFIQRGDFDADFERAINDTPALQEAVNLVVDAQAAELGPNAAFSVEALTKAKLVPDAPSLVTATSVTLEIAITSVLELSTDEQKLVLETVRGRLGRIADPVLIASLIGQIIP
jgi:hypothetical protein